MTVIDHAELFYTMTAIVCSHDLTEQHLAELRAKADRLVNECQGVNGDGECSECGEICCPHGEPLHFHHDGCPACAEESA